MLKSEIRKVENRNKTATAQGPVRTWVPMAPSRSEKAIAGTPSSRLITVAVHALPMSPDRFQLMKTILVVDDDKYFRKAGQKNLPVWHVEQEIFGVSHPDLGAYLLSLWALPNQSSKPSPCIINRRGLLRRNFPQP